VSRVPPGLQRDHKAFVPHRAMMCLVFFSAKGQAKEMRVIRCLSIPAARKRYWRCYCSSLRK